MHNQPSAFAGSGNLQCESSVPVESQSDFQAVASSSSVINVNKAANSHELTLSMYHPHVVAVDTVNWRSDELVEVPVAVGELHNRCNMNRGTQDVQSINKGIGQSRSWEDGYNWRKYGQKQIKGNEFPRSYYRCSNPNCQVKKQVERSHDGHIRDVIYRGKHDHPKPQSMSHVPACTISSVQGEKVEGISSTKNAEDMSSNGNDQPSHHPKLNGVRESSNPYGIHELSFNNILEGGVPLSRTRAEIQDNDDNPESKRRCLNSNTKMSSESGASYGKESLESHQDKSQTIVPSSSDKNMIVTVASHKMNLHVAAPDPCTDMDITAQALVPVAIPITDSQQTLGAGIGIQPMQTDYKGPCPSVTADRFWGDGYNWRKYGQKHIKGSEFPRSYYRCTHPNCHVKKQLECSHGGQITDVVYKGEHTHPKPQSSSHVAVGRILSIQEEGFEQFPSMNHTYDKSLISQTSPVQTSGSDVQGGGSILNRTDDKVEQNAGLADGCTQHNGSKETSKDAATGINHQKCKLSVEVPGKCQSQALVLSPVRDKETIVSSRELTPTVSNSPVYMVTSRGIVPVEVDTEDKRQQQSSGTGIEAEDSSQNGLSLSMTEKLLENAYHWRKYGQKNIKGSEFPRSYYRCTHPNCQVKMQLERSHDGRIIEIIYKGKHEHPKPQPITRMAIGAILSLEEDRSDRIFDDPDKSSKGHVQTSVCPNSNGISEHSPIRQCTENVETAGEKFNRSFKEVEGDHDTASQRRKKELGDMEPTPVIRTPREPRVVVETLSDVDVVDDGYRWQKYGRKIVKGNSHPRNYYRCSNGGCSVKKHVERAANNPKAVITTYEGKHNHDLPPARITTHDMAGLVNASNDTIGARPKVLVANNIDTGVVNCSIHEDENRMLEKEDVLDLEPIQTLSNITDQSTSMVVEPPSEGADKEADQNRVNKKEGISLVATGVSPSNSTAER